ncbi:hypothetical protein Tco_1178107, partial [Tanacetum coccineum]
LQSTNGSFNWLNNGSNNEIRIWYLSFNLDNQRGRRRSSRNRGSLISNITSGGDTFQIFPRVSNGVTLKSSEPEVEALENSAFVTTWVEESELDEPELVLVDSAISSLRAAISRLEEVIELDDSLRWAEVSQSLW